MIHQDVFVELNSPDLLFVTLAVVEGCVQRVGHILAVVQLANSATHLLKKNFSRENLLAVGVLPKRRLRNPHLFTHFLICGKVAVARFSDVEDMHYSCYLFHFFTLWLLLELNDSDGFGATGPLDESLTPHLMY